MMITTQTRTTLFPVPSSQRVGFGMMGIFPSAPQMTNTGERGMLTDREIGFPIAVDCDITYGTMSVLYSYELVSFGFFPSLALSAAVRHLA